MRFLTLLAMCRWIPVEVQQSSAIKPVDQVVLLAIPGDQPITLLIGCMLFCVFKDAA
jgi:hypothetical protein